MILFLLLYGMINIFYLSIDTRFPIRQFLLYFFKTTIIIRPFLFKTTAVISAAFMATTHRYIDKRLLIMTPPDGISLLRIRQFDTYIRCCRIRQPYSSCQFILQFLLYHSSLIHRILNLIKRPLLSIRTILSD